MTSLVAWIGVDSRCPSSVYLASDSRISWGEEGDWDYGRKLFASRKYPDILGYIGDVLFPSQILGQAVNLIDADLLFDTNDCHHSKHNKLSSIVKGSFVGYPIKQRRSFTIVYCSREGSGMYCIFHMSTLSWSFNRGWTEGWLDLPTESGVIRNLGSGEQSVERWYSRWLRTREGGTSRSVFSAFCDSLQSEEDKFSSGGPQVVGIYQKGPSETFGLIYKGKRYLLGLPMHLDGNYDGVEWRNSLFERCDWRTMERIPGAQRHSRPRGLGKA